MEKNIKLFAVILVGFIMPIAALAVNFPNPGCDTTAGCFLIDWGDGNNTFAGLLLFLVNLALGIVGILSVAFIIYGGFQYITSRGDEEQAGAGKKTLTNAIIGLVITILAYVIVAVVINALNGKIR